MSNIQEKFSNFSEGLIAIANSERKVLEGIEAVRTDVYKSDFAKAQQIDQLQAESKKRREATYEKLSGIIQELISTAEQREKDVSFMGDTLFVNSLQLVGMMDGDPQRLAIEGLLEKYKNSPSAIRVLLNYCTKNKVYLPNIRGNDGSGDPSENTDMYTADYAGAFRRIEDRLYWALATEWITNMYNIALIDFSAISDFAEVVGATYNTPDTITAFTFFKGA